MVSQKIKTYYCVYTAVHSRDLVNRKTRIKYHYTYVAFERRMCSRDTFYHNAFKTSRVHNLHVCICIVSFL